MSQHKPTHIVAGKLAEDLALALLTKAGLKLLVRNYACKAGEIDLIMEDRQTLVFIEVRYRQHESHGSGAESITSTKQRRIIHAASHYLAKSRGEPPPCRFDVVSIAGPDRDLKAQWIRRAFEM